MDTECLGGCAMRRINFMLGVAALSILLFNTGCGWEPPDRPVGSDGWLDGDMHKKFDTVADQLRGFDAAMVEVGYRYQELYWAGMDENWPYAAYQAEKIRTAMELGFVRRPGREDSAQSFLNDAMPAVERAIQMGELEEFEAAVRVVTASCNTCHALEDVGFMRVEIPDMRPSPIRAPAE